LGVLLDATIGAQPIDVGWWADPKVWLIAAVALIAIILVGIYMKALIEHQKFGVEK
jgi:hypothetical protein